MEGNRGEARLVTSVSFRTPLRCPTIHGKPGRGRCLFSDRCGRSSPVDRIFSSAETRKRDRYSLTNGGFPQVRMNPENESLSIQTKLFVGVTCLMGAAVLISALSHWHSADPTRFVCYLAVAILASGLKVQLPGIDGTMSVNFLFILLGVMELSLPETLLIGCLASLVQSVWQLRSRLDPVKVLFNVAGMMANASALTFLSYHTLSARFAGNKPILLMVSALVFFF